MGASKSIARAYKAALALSIGIQLSIFFYMSSVGLWIDEIRKELLGARPELKNFYLAWYIGVTVMTAPWLYLVCTHKFTKNSASYFAVQAWYGLRRESNRLMYIFWGTSMLYLACSGAMFKVSDMVRSRCMCHADFLEIVQDIYADLQALAVHGVSTRTARWNIS